MQRRELEHAAAKVTYLRGLLAVPVGVLFVLTGVGNLGWDPLANPWLFLGCLAVLGAAAVAIHRYYNNEYGRVRFTNSQQVRFTAASLACFGIPMILGTILDFHLDLPVSLFAILFGLGMLAWFAICTGLRADHVLVWGALIAVGALPVWGSFDDRASVGWIPIGVATIVAGVLDHRALVRSFGPASHAHDPA